MAFRHAFLVGFLGVGLVVGALTLGAPITANAQQGGPQATPPGQQSTATPFIVIVTATPTPEDTPIYNVQQLHARNNAKGRQNQPTGKEAVDELLLDLWPRLDASQRQARRQYLPSHSIPPGPDAPAYPDRYFDAPTDKRSKWSTMIDYAEMAYSAEVNTYDGPDGSGWFVCVRIDDGGTWEKCKSSGPVDYGHDWVQVP